MVWDLAEVATTITAASIPVLRVLLCDVRSTMRPSLSLEEWPVSMQTDSRKAKNPSRISKELPDLPNTEKLGNVPITEQEYKYSSS